MAKRDIRRYADRRQYLIAAVHKRRKKIRYMAVEYKGGACERCGFNRCIEALEFHHANSSGKDFKVVGILLKLTSMTGKLLNILPP